MSIIDNISNQSQWEELTSLKQSVDKSKRKALKKRLSSKPQATKLEYLLGAFIEMYDPHLEGCVLKLAQKGYALHVSSGFGGKHSELQVIASDFSMNYVFHNKLEKMGIKFREFDGSKSLVFWPNKASLEHIKTAWMEIIDILPDKGVLTVPSSSYEAVAFRRKYLPEDLDLQKQRLFDKLKFKIQEKVETDLGKRVRANPHPNKTELVLGLFIEELEPQVRQAVLNMNKKGYSTDASGFMDNSSDQMIEGDFQLEKETVDTLGKIGVTTETNPSGYTRIQFSSVEADISKIKNKWNKIISILPSKNLSASVSMTRKARDFRMEYE